MWVARREATLVRVHRHLRPGPNAPARARRAVTELLTHVDEDRADDVNLLVSELVTNAVRHANLREAERIQLVVCARPGHIEVKVGYPEHRRFAPTLPRERDERPEQDDETGWGLLVVDRLADRWSIVEGAGRVLAWTEVDLRHHHAA